MEAEILTKGCDYILFKRVFEIYISPKIRFLQENRENNNRKLKDSPQFSILVILRKTKYSLCPSTILSPSSVIHSISPPLASVTVSRLTDHAIIITNIAYPFPESRLLFNFWTTIKSGSSSCQRLWFDREALLCKSSESMLSGYNT